MMIESVNVKTREMKKNRPRIDQKPKKAFSKIIEYIFYLLCFKNGNLKTLKP
jgi:hypothetical protein